MGDINWSTVFSGLTLAGVLWLLKAVSRTAFAVFGADGNNGLTSKVRVLEGDHRVIRDDVSKLRTDVAVIKEVVEDLRDREP